MHVCHKQRGFFQLIMLVLSVCCACGVRPKLNPADMYTGCVLLGLVVCCAYVGYIWNRYRKRVASEEELQRQV